MNVTRLEQLFTARVAVRIATPDMYVGGLFAQERAVIERAVAKRRREFTAGRNCARSALGQLGVIAGALPMNPDRSPAWPEGYVGSITHCDGFCCAVVARDVDFAALGVDAEHDAPLKAGVARIVCRPDELAYFEGLSERGVFGWAKIAFSAKEAFFKAYAPWAKAALDFGEVEVRFCDAAVGPVRRFEIRLHAADKTYHGLQGRFEGRWFVEDGRVHTGVSLPAAALSRPWAR